MWNKKYKGYRFKSICDELEVAFKPCHKFTADLGGYAEWDSDVTVQGAIDGAPGRQTRERMSKVNGFR
jgi:hypothetical protein